MQSLLDTTPKQLEFDSASMPAAIFLDGEKSAEGEWTAARLFAFKREKYDWCVALLAEGMPFYRIAKLLKISINTVRVVRAREPRAIDAEKEELAGLARDGARMCLEGIVEALSDDARRKKIPADRLAVMAGILVDKALVLRGEASVIIGHGESKASHDDFNAALSQAIDITSEIVQAGGNAGQTRGLPAAGPAQAAGAAGPPAAGAGLAGSEPQPLEDQAPNPVKQD